MDLENFLKVVNGLQEGDEIEIVQADPSGVGFFTDVLTGKAMDVRSQYYFSSKTNVTLRVPGISISQHKDDKTGRVLAPYLTVSYTEIKNITSKN